MTKGEAWKMFSETRGRTIAFAKTFDMKRLKDPNPQGGEMFKTVGDLVGLLGGHGFWHFGQLTVNRRMLGKPKMF
jgi:uncharacterized damage-inducible protein DinB